METLETYTDHPVEFLWLELTNRCNLQCVHCYANSGPYGSNSVLTTADFRGLIQEAAELGCRQVQFIGGEPTLDPALPELIEHAHHCGMDFLEIYTNGRRLSESLLTCLAAFEVNVAVSFYSIDPGMHDLITQTPGSHRDTLANLRRIINAGINLRVGVIEMAENRSTISETVEYLLGLGIANVGVDGARKFGRAISGDRCAATDIQELCGSCWRGSLCIHPDGTASPCIMSKQWSVGSLSNSSLTDLAHSNSLREIRDRIYREVWLPKAEAVPSGATPTLCTPNWNKPCSPECTPTCHPRCSPSCSPCYPFGRCRPQTG